MCIILVPEYLTVHFKSTLPIGAVHSTG